MHYVLVHGWGFGPGIWQALAPHLAPAEISLVDLGFLGDEAIPEWPDDAVAVGHSLGLLWLLRERPGRFRALVSLQGFDCFFCHIDRAKIAAMQKGLARDPQALMRAFWRSCGASDDAPTEPLKSERLAQGLDWLASWDESGTRRSLDMPVLALASRDDAIVPQAMSRAIWGDAVRWSEDAGHVLPLRHPEWCGKEIRSFADGLRS